MNEQELTRFMREKDGALSLAFPALMRKVYVWMSLALIITGITAYGVASSPGLITAFYTNRMLMWGVVIAEFALVFALSSALNRLSLSVATLLFVVYSVLNGVMFSSIFLVYTMSSVANVFFITAGTFAAMAAYGYFTKSNLTTLGKYLLMALIGLVIATVVNIFVGSSMLSLVISYAGVLIFVGLTAYDSQKIKQMLAQQVDADETAQKVALLGALTLYLDFINLFLYLLRLLGNRR
ncbi:MAG: Bax inhibitor-1/YccA family protein [Hoylesella marshii]|uniref:Bax inhibitor-1/YccA family protein n=1 Tax=Hoylesella marshii TaxID=189722 RepID=UPI003FA018BB